jgi:hypothetical protein
LQDLTVQTLYVKHARYIELLPVLLFVLAVLRRRNNQVA